VCQRNEVSGFKEPIDDGEDDLLPTDLWQALDVIHCYVSPYCGWQVKRLKETHRLQLLHLVLLAYVARENEVTNGGAGTWHMEVRSEMV
jgi:hypothetical protein